MDTAHAVDRRDSMIWKIGRFTAVVAVASALFAAGAAKYAFTQPSEEGEECEDIDVVRNCLEAATNLQDAKQCADQ